ncbi:hypothetical protein [Nostoc sp.]|uniref:hypothetical protein n=1 Tax=Nostoc sp. TaxID=1180 RepID=UPI002FF5E0F0
MPSIHQFDEADRGLNQENSHFFATEEPVEEEIVYREHNDSSLVLRFDLDSEDLQLANRLKSSEETQIEYPEQSNNNRLPILKQNWLEQWMKPILPFLKPGGKTVALILALGIVSIPLLMISGSVWVATILAVGCTTVAIFK